MNTKSIVLTVLLVVVVVACVTVPREDGRKFIVSRSGVGPNGEEVTAIRFQEGSSEKIFFSDGRISFTVPDARIWAVYLPRTPSTWESGNRLNYWKFTSGSGLPKLPSADLRSLWYPRTLVYVSVHFGRAPENRQVGIYIYSWPAAKDREGGFAHVLAELRKQTHSFGEKAAMEEVELSRDLRPLDIGQIIGLRLELSSETFFIDDGRRFSRKGLEVVFEHGGTTYWLSTKPDRDREFSSVARPTMEEFLRGIRIPAEAAPLPQVPAIAAIRMD